MRSFLSLIGQSLSEEGQGQTTEEQKAKQSPIQKTDDQ